MESESDQLGFSNLDEIDSNTRRELIDFHRTLRQDTLANVECFSPSETSKYSPQTFYAVFCKLYEHLENIDSVMLELLDFAPMYDFKEHKANGYRSLINVTQRCLTHIQTLSRHISVNRTSYLFRTAHYLKELDSYVQALGQLRDVLHYARKLIGLCAPGELVPRESELNSEFVNEIQMEMDMIDQEYFYGRTLGFQVPLV